MRGVRQCQTWFKSKNKQYYIPLISGHYLSHISSAQSRYLSFQPVTWIYFICDIFILTYVSDGPLRALPSRTITNFLAQSKHRARKPAGTWVVERVDSVTRIPEPENTLKKWRTSCGVITRTRVPITRSQWSDVTQAERVTLYAELKQSFRIPDEAEEAFQRASLLTIGKCWRNFKHRLVIDFMKTNKPPLGLYPSMSESEWEEFSRLKSSEEFQSESLKGRELAKKNRHPHLLGTSGYMGAKKKWAKEDEEAEKYDHQPIFSDFKEERGQNWCRARV